MQFDDTVRTDTPMGLLRGIKHGTESYHVLFKRICRYDERNIYLRLSHVNTHCINESFRFFSSPPVVKSNAATPVCIALSSRAIQNRPATSQACASRTTASAIRGTPSMWPEPGVSFSATGVPAIWSMLKKYPNLGARANPTVFGKRQSRQFTGIAKKEFTEILFVLQLRVRRPLLLDGSQGIHLRVFPSSVGMATA